MNPYWSHIVSELEPYVPGEQPRDTKFVKLNTNENPHPPSPRALAAMKAEASGTLRLYPDPNSEGLKQAVAEYFGKTSDCVFVGNGSDEVLAHVFRALMDHGRSILFPDVSYSFYPVYCGLFSIGFERIPLTESFDIDLSGYLRPNGGIIFPNPNAPTGKLMTLGGIEELLDSNRDSVVVVDEAYIDFGGKSAIPLTSKFPNLLVVQTLSKSRSLAGLRVGFAVGHPGLIEAIERVKNSFNSYPLSRIAQAGAIAAMQDVEYFRATCEKVISSRSRLAGGLKALGFEVLPSAANFIFTRHRKYDAATLCKQLRAHNIIVRHFTQPSIEQFLRITVGTDAECEVLLGACAELVAF